MMAYDDSELLDIVDAYAEKWPNFDNSFAESLREALDNYDELTPGQRQGLENIVVSFRMIKEE